MNRIERRRHDALTATVAATKRLVTAQDAVDTAVAQAIHWGASWAEIGAALGVSRQSAHRRYRHLHWDPTTRTRWHETPLPL